MKALQFLQRCRAVKMSAECGGSFYSTTPQFSFQFLGFFSLCIGENRREVYAE